VPLDENANLPAVLATLAGCALYKDLKHDTELFLAAARLVAVLWLRLSGTVEHIFELELRMQGHSALAVRFEGQRHRQYSNVEPAIIRVEGVCSLQ
jgi:hypothetical protein